MASGRAGHRGSTLRPWSRSHGSTRRWRTSPPRSSVCSFSECSVGESSPSFVTGSGGSLRRPRPFPARYLKSTRRAAGRRGSACGGSPPRVRTRRRARLRRRHRRPASCQRHLRKRGRGAGRARPGDPVPAPAGARSRSLGVSYRARRPLDRRDLPADWTSYAVRRLEAAAYDHGACSSERSGTHPAR